MKHKDYDVVVIGAGIGGMCATALLAQAGYRVLLTEKLPQLGGRCSSIEVKGHIVPYVAQEQPVRGLTPSIFEQVGAEFDVVPLPPVVYRIDGRDLQLPPKGGFAYLFSQVCDDPAEIQRVLDALRRSRKWDAVSESISFGDWMSQYTQNERLMNMVQNVFCVLLASRMSEVPARSAVGFYNLGMRQWVAAARPRKGNLALMESLAAAIRAHGGEIWTRAAVRRILTEDDRVRGVVVARDGEETEVRATAVVSNAGPLQTIDMVGESKIELSYLKEIKDNLQHGSQMLVSFVSDRPLVEHPGGLGFMDTRRVVNVSTITLTCPDVSPPGEYLHTAQCMPPSNYGELDTEAEITAAITDLREQIPDFDRVAEILNISCFFNREWPCARNVPGYYPSQKTPIENLYNIGDGVIPYGEAGTPGSALTARIVTEDIQTRFQPGA